MPLPSMPRLSLPVLLCAAALGLAGCGGGTEFTAGGRPLPTPDTPGIYVLTSNNDLHRIDGSAQWERKTWASRADFSPGARLIVYDPALSGVRPGWVQQDIKLWRVSWLRSDLEPTGQAAPVRGSQWVVAGLNSMRVPLRVTPNPRVPGVYELAPAGRLDPGLYELQISAPGVEGQEGRFGILWPSVDKRTYSAAHCVDRVVGGGAGFRPCTSAGASESQTAYNTAPTRALARPPLKIKLFSPVHENGGLKIRGEVINTSSRVQRVPNMQATLVGRSGQPVDSWVFAPPQTSIAPGGRMAFVAWRPFSGGSTRLNVDFVRTDQRAGLQ